MSENIQLGSMLMGSRNANPQPVSSRKEAGYQASQTREDAPVQSDTENSARDFASDGRKKTVFDKVLNQRLEKRSDETPDSVETPEEGAQPQVDPEAALTLAKLLAQFGSRLQTPAEGEGNPSAQQGGTSAVPLPVQTQSASAVPQNPTSVMGALQTDAMATEGQTVPPGQTAQTGQSAMFQPPAASGEQAAVTETGEPLAKTALTHDSAPAPEKSAAGQMPEKVQTPAVQGQAVEEKPAAAQAGAAQVTAKETVPQDAVTQADSDVADIENAEISAKAGLEKALQAKEDNEPDSSTLSTDRAPIANASESTVSSNAHHAAAAVAHTSQKTVGETFQAPEKPTLSVTETADVSKIRASDPVTASRTVDQIAQKLSLEQPIRTDQQIRLTLTPQELGTVRITFREQGNEVIGMLEVQKPQTRKELEDSVPQLLTTMQTQGVQVRRIEVVQWNPPQQQSRDGFADGFNPSAEREFFQQRTGQHEGSGQRGSFTPDGFASGSGKTSSADPYNPREYFSDKGLNLYI